jgi:lipopolysaccharide export system permease protein
MLLTFFIVLFILMLNFLWLYIDDVIGKGLSMGVIAEFIFWGTASYIPLALPLSTLLASIMTMGNLGENNELLAMKATGISLQRIMRPLMLLAMSISIGAFFVSNDLLPYTTLQIKTLLFDIQHKREEIKIPAGMFYNGIEDLSLYVEKQDEVTGLMHSLMLYDHRAKKGNTSVTLADSGYIRLTKNKQHIIFTFYHGYAYEEGESNGQAKDTAYPFQRRYFDRQDVLVPLYGYDFPRSDGSRFNDDAQTQNINRLSFMEDSLHSLQKSACERFIQNFLTPVYLPHYNLHDSLLRARQVHTAAFDSLYNTFPEKKQLDAVRQAYSTFDRSALYIANYAAEHEKDDYPRRRVEIEWHRKFTLSFACLVFFFIIYWVIDISGKKLSRDGVWDPFFGTWVSSMVLLPIGIFLTYKATSDSSLFNAEKYMAFFRNLAKKLKTKSEK